MTGEIRFGGRRSIYFSFRESRNAMRSRKSFSSILAAKSAGMGEIGETLRPSIFPWGGVAPCPRHRPGSSRPLPRGG